MTSLRHVHDVTVQLSMTLSIWATRACTACMYDIYLVILFKICVLHQDSRMVRMGAHSQSWPNQQFIRYRNSKQVGIDFPIMLTSNFWLGRNQQCHDICHSFVCKSEEEWVVIGNMFGTNFWLEKLTLILFPIRTPSTIYRVHEFQACWDWISNHVGILIRSEPIPYVRKVFWATNQDPFVSKSNQLYVRIFQVFLIKLGFLVFKVL